jgi:hypothetical protein
MVGIDSWSCANTVLVRFCGNSEFVSTSDRAVVCQPLLVCPFFNELILGWELGSTQLVNRILSIGYHSFV